MIHKYGPHIFHTVEERVWDYLSNFTDWNIYHHEVLGVVDGKRVPIPFNLNTLHSLLPGVLADNIEEKLVKKYGFGKKVTILELKKENDDDLKFLADFVYEKVFLNYTIKQWGMKPEDSGPKCYRKGPGYLSAGITGISRIVSRLCPQTGTPPCSAISLIIQISRSF